MISDYNNNEIQKLIKDNELLDPFEVSLRLKKHDGEIRKYVSQQILSRNKARKKIPEWFASEELVFPAPISVEQASSSIAARYKANLISGGLLLDLTGGMGVDSYFFSKVAREVWYVERDPDLVKIADWNFKKLRCVNIKIFCQDSIEFLKSLRIPVDCVYIDPSRRPGKKKVFKLEDSEPDILALMDILRNTAEKIIIKAAPYLDIKDAIKKIGALSEVHVLAIENECKEILLVASGNNSSTRIITVNIADNHVHEYRKTYNEEQVACCEYGLEGKFLYDPNVAIRKAGLFNSICRDYKVNKIASNSHLYINDSLISNFPGRIFEIFEICTFNILLRKYRFKKGNIAVRNFPVSVKEIRKKTGIKEGGNLYIFGTTDRNKNTIFIIGRKI